MAEDDPRIPTQPIEGPALCRAVADVFNAEVGLAVAAIHTRILAAAGSCARGLPPGSREMQLTAFTRCLAQRARRSQ